MMAVRKVHPMDPTGGAFTYEEFVAFAGEVDGKRMWDEAVAIDDDIPSFGNWAGVVRNVHQKRVFLGVKSDCGAHGRALCRSYSHGCRRRNGRVTDRHPDGHPTASGLGWLAAK